VLRVVRAQAELERKQPAETVFADRDGQGGRLAKNRSHCGTADMNHAMLVPPNYRPCSLRWLLLRAILP